MDYRRSSSIVLAATMLLGVLICSAASAKKVTISYWHGWTGEWKAEIDKIVKQFNDTHPNIEVKPVVISDQSVTQKLVTSMAAGICPDVVTIWDSTLASLADKNLLLSLDPFMGGDKKEIRNWFYPYALQLGVYNGKVWALPSSINSNALLYNKRILQEAGLDPSRPPATIDELDLYSQKASQKNAAGGWTRLGFWPDSLLQWGHQFGGRFYDPSKSKVTFNDPKVIKALEWMASYGRKYDLKLVDKFASSLGGDRSESKDPFIAGKYAMVLHGQWKIGDIKKFAKKDFAYGAAFLPSAPGGPHGSCVINGNMQIIPRGSKHQKEAWEFVKFWSGIDNEEYAANMMNIGDRPVWVPVSPVIYKSPTYQRYVKSYPALDVFVDAAADKNTLPTYIMPAQQSFFDQLWNAQWNGSRGIKSPQQALETAQAEAQKEIDRQLNKLKKK